ncbi:hypothetical protein [Frankia sp. CiP3]|uniref:hypothetical protein n=1 Tax=Frankia sp. CiP3 TaxID=2880971 RepID=UPI001EF4E0C5|nr:hypothetical protein [Frankia sp. CiP3]
MDLEVVLNEFLLVDDWGLANERFDAVKEILEARLSGDIVIPGPIPEVVSRFALTGSRDDVESALEIVVEMEALYMDHEKMIGHLILVHGLNLSTNECGDFDRIIVLHGNLHRATV